MYYIYLLGTPTIKDGRSPQFGCLYFCQKMQAYCRAQVRKVRVEPNLNHIFGFYILTNNKKSWVI